MISKNLYLTIILYVLTIAACSVGAGYLIFTSGHWMLSAILFVMVAIFTIMLIRYINETNRRLSFFIDSIRNEDTSIRFPENTRSKPVLDLYRGLNGINELLRRIKVESAYNEQLLKTLIEYSTTGFITIDEHGYFEVMNGVARKYLGVEHTAHLKRIKQTDPGLYHHLTHLKIGESKIYRLHQGNRFYDLSISVTEIVYYEKRFRAISMQDISFQLEEKELESWHKLFRVITHEIMNSIAPITSLSNTLARFYKKNNEPKQAEEITDKIVLDTLSGLKVIDDMSNGLMRFVQSYRQLSKIPTPKREKIELKSWLSDIKLVTNEMIDGKNINLKITLSNQCKVLYADEKLLNQVMLNLIKNAVEALEEAEQKGLQIRVHLDDEGHTALCVKDSGSGIADEDLDRIFVPFFTTKENGSGIGLSLSKQIVKLHGGSLSVNSKHGEGTQFTMSI